MKVIVVAFISEWDNGGITAGIFLASILLKERRYLVYTAISIKVVHEQSRKVEYEPERLLGKLINLLTIPSSLSRSYSTFPLCSWTSLIEIAV
jgi:hypothetical protein